MIYSGSSIRPHVEDLKIFRGGFEYEKKRYDRRPEGHRANTETNLELYHYCGILYKEPPGFYAASKT